MIEMLEYDWTEEECEQGVEGVDFWTCPYCGGMADRCLWRRWEASWDSPAEAEWYLTCPECGYEEPW
jgi:predicted RNA-binding Zn-ribbon protein involved in translation (DUF1610 family)